jgi:predicted enzyme related to lactoylglutathione lyase
VPAPNLFLVYVTDIDRATDFYSRLFDIEATVRSPRYVAFDAGGTVTFALWSGRPDHAHSATPRTSEIGVMLPGPASRIDDVFRDWSTTAGLVVVESPHDDVFGRTFVVADPDGNLVRVAPVD